MKRIQRKRAKGWRMPPNSVYVGRPTKWGNPYSVDKWGAEGAVELYRIYLTHNRPLLADARRELRGKDLACWCRLGQPCHADVLIELIEAVTE